MKHIEIIHVELTPFQIHIVNKIREKLPAFTDDELATHIVALGILALGKKYDDESEDTDAVVEKYDGALLPHRQLGESISVALPAELRLRLEKLLTVCPTMEENEAFTTLMDLGAETLIELGVIRERDLAVRKGEA